MTQSKPSNRLKKFYITLVFFFITAVISGAIIFIVDKWVVIKIVTKRSFYEITKEKIPHAIDSNIISDLQSGGHTIYIRHSTKHKLGNISIFDETSMVKDMAIPSNLFDGGCLTEVGESEAWLMGKAFKKLNIPVGKVYASPTCRTVQTAKMAFGHVDFIDNNLNYRNISHGTKKSETASKKKVLDIFEIAPGIKKNKIIVAHGGITPLLGWHNSDIPQSGMFIVKHTDGNQLELITEVTLASFLRAMRLHLAK